jgi:hypothetical protein
LSLSRLLDGEVPLRIQCGFVAKVKAEKGDIHLQLVDDHL